MVFSTNITYNDVIEIIQKEKTLKKYTTGIVSVFQIGVRTFNITYDKEEKRQIIYTETEGKIKTNNREARIYLPKKNNWFYINIRAVPTEVDDEEMEELLVKLNCGKIMQIDKIKHRDTGYYNGYRSV